MKAYLIVSTFTTALALANSSNAENPLKVLSPDISTCFKEVEPKSNINAIKYPDEFMEICRKKVPSAQGDNSACFNICILLENGMVLPVVSYKRLKITNFSQRSGIRNQLDLDLKNDTNVQNDTDKNQQRSTKCLPFDFYVGKKSGACSQLLPTYNDDARKMIACIEEALVNWFIKIHLKKLSEFVQWDRSKSTDVLMTRELILLTIWREICRFTMNE